MNECKSKYSIVTSFNKRIFDSDSQQIVLDMQQNHSDVNFYVYHENSFEKKSYNQEIDFSKLKRENLYTYDLFQSVSWLHDFLKSSPFNKCEDYGFKGCDPSHSEYWKRNSIYWFRKIAAIEHCVDLVDTDYLIWLDADTVFRTDKGHTDGFDRPFFEFVSNFDCSVIKRGGASLETGIVVFNLKKQGRLVIDEWLNYYKSLMAFKHSRWDDGYILTKVMQQTQNDKYSFGDMRHDIPLVNQVYRYVRHYKAPLLKIRDKNKGI